MNVINKIAFVVVVVVINITQENIENCKYSAIKVIDTNNHWSNIRCESRIPVYNKEGKGQRMAKAKLCLIAKYLEFPAKQLARQAKKCT